MMFKLTTTSRKALKEIKEKMIAQFENKDINRLVVKFTKKKEFTAIPSPLFKCPAFQLFVNDKFYKTFVCRDGKWDGLK